MTYTPISNTDFYIGAETKIVVIDEFSTGDPVCDVYTYKAYCFEYYDLPSCIVFDPIKR